MASSVTNISSTINTNFPKIGEGFSNIGEFQANFKKIRDSFTRLVNENSEHIKQSFQRNKDNDFGGNVLKRTVFQNHSYAVNNLGLVDNGVINLNYREGYYHKAVVNSGYYTFNVTNWTKRNTVSKIRLEVYNQNTATSSTFFIGFSGDVKFFGTPTSQVNLTGNTSIFYDIWTTNSGESIFVKPIGSISADAATYYGSGSAPSGGGSLPTITSLSPTGVGALGGELLTINGTNFTVPITVKINNIAVTTSSGSPTAITLTVPGNDPNIYNLMITTAAGSTSTSLFYYENRPGGSNESGGPGE